MIDVTQLSPEEQAIYQEMVEGGQVPADEAVMDDATIDQVVDVRRAGEDRTRAMSRMEQALAKQQGAGLAQALSPRAVPSAWGPILQKRSPLEKIIAGIGSFKGAYDAKQARTDEMAAGERQMQGIGAIERVKQGQSKAYNDAATARLLEAIRAEAARRRMLEDARTPPEMIEVP